MSTAAADQTLPLVRDSVRNVLTRSASFRALPPEERRRLAHDMVKVARYIVDAGGETAGIPVTAQIATGLADPPPAPPPKPPSAVDKFTGDVAKKSAASFTDMIGKVDFPKFVGGLVEGVFNAIVTSSIRQMEAYSEMVANIAKSADQYMKDNVTENQARDYLAGKYPEHLQVDASKGKPTLVPRKPERRSGRERPPRPGGRPVSQSLAGGPFGIELPDFQKDLGLQAPVQKLDAKTVEEKLVPAARMRIAMDRQQLLATMVLMGINRLIVTDGKISASCLFQLDTTEAAFDDKTYATEYDSKTTGFHVNYRNWYGPSVYNTTSNFKVSTTDDSSSEAQATMHAELTGNVDINFRSETFPLEKMADVLQIKEIEQKAPAAATPAVTPVAPPANLPPPPPLPNLPGSPFAPAAPAPGSG